TVSRGRRAGVGENVRIRRNGSNRNLRNVPKQYLGAVWTKGGKEYVACSGKDIRSRLQVPHYCFRQVIEELHVSAICAHRRRKRRIDVREDHRLIANQVTPECICGSGIRAAQ